MTYAFEQVRYGTETVDGLDIFYREAGNPHKEPIVLLHGFPSSSHMYRDVLSALGDQFYLIAPDYPGFGESSAPSADEFDYSFDRLADIMETFLEQKGITRYVLMMQDFGAPVGYRLALRNPQNIKGLIAMNANAYAEGMGEGWGPIPEYWETASTEIEQIIIDNVFTLEGTKWQYTHGTRDASQINPDNWNLDFYKISRPGVHRIMLNLIYDYQNNLKQYPDWQAYLRDQQPPLLIVWGKNDPFFPESGAQAYQKDVQNIDYNILETGHFALEEDAEIINDKIRRFMTERILKSTPNLAAVS